MYSAGTMDGVFKIGCSTEHPIKRAAQLSAPASCISPFVVAYSKRVEFPFDAEAKIHRVLKDYRVNNSREFFMVSLDKIISCFDHFDELPEKASDDDGGTEYPWAWLFNSFPDDGSARELTKTERRACAELEWHLKHGDGVD